MRELAQLQLQRCLAPVTGHLPPCTRNAFDGPIPTSVSSDALALFLGPSGSAESPEVARDHVSDQGFFVLKYQAEPPFTLSLGG